MKAEGKNPQRRGQENATPGLSRAKPESPWRIAMRRLASNRTAMVGLGVLLTLALLAALAPLIAPYQPLEMDYRNQLQAPSSAHWFGTDLFGRDILSRLLHGGRITLVIGLIAVAISSSIGVLLGLISGFYGGKVDTVIMRFIDVLLAFPRILLALCVVALMGVGLTNAMIAVGISGISGYARLVRASVLSAKEQVYVEGRRVA